MLICKRWRAIGFDWQLLRERQEDWYYLERDGKIIAEGKDPLALLSQGKPLPGCPATRFGEESEN